VKDRPGHGTGATRSTARRPKRELGWEPKIDFEAGLKKTFDWYKAKRDLDRPGADGRIPVLLREALVRQGLAGAADRQTTPVMRRRR